MRAIELIKELQKYVDAGENPVIGIADKDNMVHSIESVTKIKGDDIIVITHSDN